MAGKWWEYMPQPTYNTWQANKFKQQAMDRIAEIEQKKAAEMQAEVEKQFQLVDRSAMAPGDESEPVHNPMEEGGESSSGNPLLDLVNQQSQQMPNNSVVEGMVGGGLVKDAFKKGAQLFGAIHNSPLGSGIDAVGNTLSTIGGGIRDAYNYSQDNIVHPGSGLLGAISQNNVLDLLNPIAASQHLGQRIGNGEDISSLGIDNGSPSVRHTNGPSTSLTENRNNMNGFNRFAFDTLADPLTYVGGYGKAIEGVPMLGGIGKAVSAVEHVPGQAMSAALGGVGKAISIPLAHTPIGDLTRPSTGNIAREEASQLANSVRRALDQYITHKGGYAGMDPAAVQELRTLINSGASNSDLDAIRRTMNTVSPTGKIGDILHTSTSTNPEQFAQAIHEVGARNTRAELSAQIQAQRATQGVKGQVLNKLDDVYNGVWEGMGASKWPGIAPMQRAASGAILNTLGFPVGNTVEDAARALTHSGDVGRMFPAEAASKIASVTEDVPTSVFMGDTDPLISQALGRAKPTGRISKIINAPMEASGRLTDPIRRNFWVGEYQKALGNGLATADAVEAATNALNHAFPIPNNEHAYDVVAKQLFPYWNYEKKRLPYLLQTAAEKPGTTVAYENYRDNTDKGSMHVPGTDYEFNPTRGTVLGVVNNVTKPEYPTYKTGLSGDIEQGLNRLGRAGFYPGTAVNAGLAIQAGLQHQPMELGSLLPGTAQVPLQAIEATGALPGALGEPGRMAQGIQEQVANTRFRENQISRELANMKLDPDKATPQQRAEATARVSRANAISTETGFLGWKPRAEQQYKDDRVQAAIDAGVPEDIARNPNGNPLTAADPTTGQRYINSATLRSIYEQHPDWENWRKASEPLQRPADRAINNVTDEYNQMLDDVDKRANDKLTELYTRMNDNSTEMSGDMFRKQRSNIMAEASNARDAVKEIYKKRGALVDEQSRNDFYQKQGREVTGKTPEDEAAANYYNIKPDDFINQRTGVVDFKAWRTAQQDYLAKLDDKTRTYVTDEFPRKKQQDNPLVASGEESYKKSMDAAQQYFDMPKYVGLSDNMQQAISRASALVQSYRTMYPWMDNETAQAFAMMREPLGAALLPVASQLSNPSRKQFLSKHPEVAWMFSNAPKSVWEDPLFGPDNSL